MIVHIIGIPADLPDFYHFYHIHFPSFVSWAHYRFEKNVTAPVTLHGCMRIGDTTKVNHNPTRKLDADFTLSAGYWGKRSREGEIHRCKCRGRRGVTAAMERA